MESGEKKDGEDKTEEASDEKRNQFREEGNIANPKEIVGAAVLMFFSLYFYLNANSIMKGFELTLRNAWLGFSPQNVNASNIISIIYYVVKPNLNHIFIIFFASILFPLLIGLVLTKFNFTLKKLNFNLEKINPIPGIGKIFSGNTLVELIKIIIKFCVFSLIIYFVIKSKIIAAQALYFFNHIEFLKEIGSSVFMLLISISLSVVLLGFGDFAHNLWKIEKELKMSKQEVKDDIKKHEGDPQLRSRRKRMARELILKKSLKDVPKATFIVTNPEHFAVAIRYIKGMNAPIIVAKGQDLMAFKIREIAKKNNIIIVENKPLARTLYKTVKIGQEVPASLYQALIEIMKYIYRIRGKNYFDQKMSPSLSL